MSHLAFELPGAQVRFTSRHGGVSRGPYESLNLGRWTDDDPDAVERNRRLVEEMATRQLAYARQVHGARVVALESGQAGLVAEGADGLVTVSPDVAVMVLTADCLPVAVAGGGAVAMLHAGWRGLATGVLAAGVKAIRSSVGSGVSLQAVIGPGAGACCYEVGPEVHEAFADAPAAARRGRMIDMKAIAAAQLSAAGVDSVRDCDVCTICSPDHFSHRRSGGVTGRQAGVAWLS